MFLWMLTDSFLRAYVSQCAYLGCLNYCENKNGFAVTIPISCCCNLLECQPYNKGCTLQNYCAQDLNDIR